MRYNFTVFDLTIHELEDKYRGTRSTAEIVGLHHAKPATKRVVGTRLMDIQFVGRVSAV